MSGQRSIWYDPDRRFRAQRIDLSETKLSEKSLIIYQSFPIPQSEIIPPILPHIQLLSKDCLFHILLHVSIGDISSFFSINKFYTYHSKDSLWKVKVNQICNDDCLLRLTFVQSVDYGIYPLFNLLSPIVQRKQLWTFSTDIKEHEGERHSHEFLIGRAIYSGCKQIVKSILEVHDFESKFSFDYEELYELCNLSKYHKDLPTIGSIEDDILRIYMLIMCKLELTMDSSSPIESMIRLLIRKLELRDLDIWLERFNLGKKKVNIDDCTEDYYLDYFLEKLIITLCRLDEYESFIEYFGKLRDSEARKFTSDKIVKIDCHPFKYVTYLVRSKFLKENVLDTLLLDKERLKKR